MHDFDRFYQNIEDIRRFNDIMGIDYVDVTSSVEFIDGTKDIGEMVNLPDFLEKSLTAGFSPKAPSEEEDYRLRTIYGYVGKKKIEMTREEQNHFQDLWQTWAKHYNAVKTAMSEEADLLLTKVGDNFTNKDQLRLSSLKASMKEIDKLQLLIGAPLFHHVLSIDTHYVHEDVPQSFNDSPVDFSFITEMAKYMRSKSNYSSENREFKLPIGTSQGLTLKSSRDTGMWRAFSKVILAQYAVRSESGEHLQMFKDRVNDVFLKHGYDEVAQHSFLGLRRQQLAYSKEEPALMLNSLSLIGYRNVLITRKLQGRARAIFPFSETIKAWFKPLADGVKKHLFGETCLHTTDPIKISNCLHKITQLSLDHKLIDREGGYYTFYDLSAYDRTTHRGLNNLYEKWLATYDPNFSKMYSVMHNDAGVIYPLSCDRDPMICLEDIGGRSTLSGQADVTVKNNIIHLIIAIGLISYIKNKPADHVYKALLYNEGPEADNMIGLIHGDDAALYFSEDPNDYEIFAKLYTDLGVVTGFEAAPVYLKKIVDHDNAAHFKTLSISSVKSANESIMKKKGNKSSVMKDHDYNVKYMYGMMGVTGSLLKNRFGEYAQQDSILALLSIIDTYRLMNESPVIMGHVTDLYNIQLRILGEYYQKAVAYDKVKDIISDDGTQSSAIMSRVMSSGIADLAGDETLNKDMIAYMQSMVSLNTPKAQQMRQTVSKIVHTLGEDFLDEDMKEIYGLINYDVQQEAEVLGISSLTRDQLLDAICDLQDYILTHDGLCPSQEVVTDIMSKYKN